MELHTTQLQEWQKRMQAGDAAAREELIGSILKNVERLARKMLRGFPNVHRWAETDDVMQNSLLRLMRSLEKIQPTSVREFFGLAALEIRRELLDQARHFDGPQGQGANHASQSRDRPGSIPARESAEGSPDADLERWTAFHQKVEQLPAEEREVVGLMYYHGLSSMEAAEILKVTDRTIRRWWNAALVKLHDHAQDGSLGA